MELYQNFIQGSIYVQTHRLEKFQKSWMISKNNQSIPQGKSLWVSVVFFQPISSWMIILEVHKKLWKYMDFHDIKKPILPSSKQWLFHFYWEWCLEILRMGSSFSSLVSYWTLRIEQLKEPFWKEFHHIGICFWWWDSSRHIVVLCIMISCLFLSIYLGPVTTP